MGLNSHQSWTWAASYFELWVHHVFSAHQFILLQNCNLLVWISVCGASTSLSTFLATGNLAGYASRSNKMVQQFKLHPSMKSRLIIGKCKWNSGQSFTKTAINITCPQNLELLIMKCYRIFVSELFKNQDIRNKYLVSCVWHVICGFLHFVTSSCSVSCLSFECMFLCPSSFHPFLILFIIFGHVKFVCKVYWHDFIVYRLPFAFLKMFPPLNYFHCVYSNMRRI